MDTYNYMMDKYIKFAASLEFSSKKHKENLRNLLKEKFKTQNPYNMQLADDELLNVAGGITNYENKNKNKEIKISEEQQ